MRKQRAEQRHHRFFSWGDEGRYLMQSLHATSQDALITARRQSGAQFVGADPLTHGSAMAVESVRFGIKQALSDIEEGTRVEFVGHNKQTKDIMGGVALARYVSHVDGSSRVALSYWRNSTLDVRSTADMCQAAIRTVAQEATLGKSFTDAEIRIPSSDRMAQRVAFELGATTTGQLFLNGPLLEAKPAAAAFQKWHLKVGGA